MKSKLDQLDRRILNYISKNARTAFLEIARDCGVSSAAIHQRVNKLFYSGILSGSEFIINNYNVGYQTCAYVGINVNDSSKVKELTEDLKTVTEIVECHYTAGKHILLLKVFAKDNKDLLDIIHTKISSIDNVKNAEVLHLSVDEVFKRQLDIFG